MINIMKPSIKFKDVEVGDVFYYQGFDDVPYLKIKYYIPENCENLIASINLSNGVITKCKPDTYVRLYKETKLTIEV